LTEKAKSEPGFCAGNFKFAPSFFILMSEITDSEIQQKSVWVMDFEIRQTGRAKCTLCVCYVMKADVVDIDGT